jgi:TonB-linked SusC/RagA family outer membrane protein
MWRHLIPWAALTGLTALATTRVASAQTGVTISGRVTDAVTGEAVPAAQVAVIGTTAGAISGEDGRYSLRTSGAVQLRLRVLRVGYAETVKAVTVQTGQPSTVDFALQAVSVQLAPVVTTATGQQRRVELGNAIAQVDVARTLETSPIANISDLLTARAAGVQVLSSGATGTGARVRIRGTSSLSLNNDPVYIVDGVRIEASSTGVRAQGIGVGGSLGSRLNDLNPEEIESIELVKGPSAATLYGTDAANGVIVVTTKKGRRGAVQWNVYGERGRVSDPNTYPENFAAWGRTTSGAVTNACFIVSAAAGQCMRDSVSRWQALNNPETSILGTGARHQLGVQLSGGSELLRFFLSGETEGETGLLELPAFERDRLAAAGRAIPDYQDRPNALSRRAARANLNSSPSMSFDLATNVGYSQNRQRLPNLDNNLFSPMAQALFGPGYRTTTTTSTGAILNGYRNFTPGDIFEESYQSANDRLISSSGMHWRPFSWLAARGNFGLDFTSARDTDVCRFATCPDNGTTRLGFSLDDRRHIWQYTTDLGGTATWSPTPSLSSRTSVGAQYFRNELSRDRATGTQLPPGSSQPAAGSIPSVLSTSDETRTLGLYVEEALAWRERLFFTGAARYDDNSAFGSAFKGVVYPKASVSWLISEEDFFPRSGMLDQLRLRAALGQSGVRPGTNDALQFFAAGPAATVRLNDGEIPGIAVASLGNPDLRPETTTEFDAGVDIDLFQRRVNVELTYYTKTSRDALIARVLPPSMGTGPTNTTRFENLGAVRNRGVEAMITSQILDSKRLGWDLSISGSSNRNTLVDMGGVPPQVGTTTRQTAGFPLNGYWQRKYTFADGDNNGIITASEVTVDDSATYVGSSIPLKELVLTSGVELFGRTLRIQALADYKGGHYLYNNTERFKCVDARNCQGRNDPGATLFEQARSVAAADHPARTLYGFMEKADFLRLREVSVQWSAPARLAAALRTKGISAMLSARNIALWSDYTGIDPESSYGQTDIPNDFLTLPPARYMTLRVNLKY